MGAWHPGLRLLLFSPRHIQSPDLLWILLLGLLKNTLFRCFSLSLFQFDGDSAYVGMSDGNPELLSTSQVGAPSFLSWGVSNLGLTGAQPPGSPRCQLESDFPESLISEN